MLEIAAVMMERAADGPAELGARRCLGMSQMYAGDLSGAETSLRWVVEHYDFDRHHGLAVRFSYDPCVVALYYLAFTRRLCGDANEAHAQVAAARSLAERIGHPPTLVATFGITAFLDCVRRDPTRAVLNAERAVALAGDFNLPTWRMIGALTLSQARADLAATPAGWDELAATLARCEAQGVGLPEIHRSYLAEGYAGVSELEPAFALANQALANMETKGLRAFLPEAHRVRGEIMLKRDPADPAPAEQAFQAAIAVARAQGSRSFELRAALSLAKLYQSAGRPAEAQAVLAPALEGFSPTPEMAAIAEAEELLAALAQWSTRNVSVRR